MAKIGIVGAGIIGSAIATWLIDAGHDITVFDSEPDGLPTSSGNASLIALPEIAPLASPGILSSVPKWLLDPLGPLTIRWSDLPALTPWLLAFLASATPAHGRKVREALTFLMRTGLADHEELARKAGLSGHLRQTGYLALHDTEQSLGAAVAESELVKSALGFDYERVDATRARQLVPAVEGQFAGAIYQPGYWAASNPLTVLRHYQRFVAERGRIVHSKVSRLQQTADGIAIIPASGEQVMFDKVVVAAGVWSRELVRGLGLKVLLETERGYNTTFTDLDWNLPMPVGFADHGFVATPLVDGLRVGGAVELAKPDTPANFGRAKAMRTKMRRYIPSLPEGGKEWMGRRPSTPDSMPVISQHPKDDRIVFAFGHGHLGLTLSAVTARHVAALVAQPATDPALAPFSISRFQ